MSEGLANREWYTLEIAGERVGYAYHGIERRGRELVDSRVMRVEVMQLQHRSVLESRADVIQDAAGKPARLSFESKVGVSRVSWQGEVRETNGASLSVSSMSPAELSSWPASLASGFQPLWCSDQTPHAQPFFGTQLVWKPCTKACDARIELPFDAMAQLVVRSPYHIPSNALNGPIRYVISHQDGSDARLPVTGEQAVVMDGARAVVTICKTCGTQAETLSDADRRRYLAPNAWVQSDLREVRSFALRNSHEGTPSQIMSKLVDGVRDYMTGMVDYLGYATASDALRTRSGDCTEFAVLLAAAARSRGIPARLAIGLVYSGRFSGKKDVFSPHMWVQAWTGERWESYDAGLGKFDATHIALAIGDGDPRGVAALSAAGGKWAIEKVGQVRLGGPPQTD